MTTATYGHSGFTRVFICFGLIALTAGCTGMNRIKPSQATIDPESSVIAFSVNTRALSGYFRPIRPAGLYFYTNEGKYKIRISRGNTGLQRFLIEVPAQTVILDQFDLAAGDFMGSPFLYGTEGLGPEIQLTQGEITYLGRLEIEDIQFAASADNSSGQPIGIKLVFSDALEDDLLAWKQKYRLFQDRLPNQRIAGNWGENWSGLEYTPVNYIESRRRGGFDLSGFSLPNIVLPSLSF